MENQQNLWKIRALPAELLNELFGSMPLENAAGLLAKIPNGLLARNVQKMVDGIKKALKNNKWNVLDCGPKLAISEDEFTVKHSGPDECNCIRTILPIATLNLNIDKPRIAFYFEIQILAISICRSSIRIGFCNQQFPLEGEWLSGYNSPLGIWYKSHIIIERYYTKIGNDNGYFSKGDVIGLGIINHPNAKMQCFATCNGKLLGKAQLPSTFGNFQLFPAVVLHRAGDSIRMNSGKEEWQYKDFKSVLGWEFVASIKQ